MPGSVDSALAAERAARLALRASPSPHRSGADDPVGAEVLALVRRARSREAATGERLHPPVLVLAGGTGVDGEARVRSYRDELLTGLAGFCGTVVSGGTTVGIAALAGDLRQSAGDGIRAIGYPPRHLPGDVALESDSSRIDEVRRTSGVGFSVAEPLAYWRDILEDSTRATPRRGTAKNVPSSLASDTAHLFRDQPGRSTRRGARVRRSDLAARSAGRPD